MDRTVQTVKRIVIGLGMAALVATVGLGQTFLLPDPQAGWAVPDGVPIGRVPTSEIQVTIVGVGRFSVDPRAAQDNGVLFYPIVPGEEDASWERFYHEGLPRFLSGTYTREYEQELVDRFERALPERPPWEVRR